MEFVTLDRVCSTVMPVIASWNAMECNASLIARVEAVTLHVLMEHCANYTVELIKTVLSQEKWSQENLATWLRQYHGHQTNMESISTKERPTMAAALIPVGLSLWLPRPLCFCTLSVITAAISKSRRYRFSLTHLSKQSVRETVGQQLYFTIYRLCSCCLHSHDLQEVYITPVLRPFRQDRSVRVENMFFVRAWLSLRQVAHVCRIPTHGLAWVPNAYAQPYH